MRARLLLACSALAAAAATAGLPIRAASDVPVIRQVLRNNCETAALSMILASRGVHIDQLRLQRTLSRSGPLDPTSRPDGTLVWGDPDMGFVGRAAGGGTHGGYGVYTAPIKALAARYGVRLVSLNHLPPERLYERLRHGRPVLAWVALSQGPYLRWRTPAGKVVVGNFGEHTVVLTAVRGDTIYLNDPLSGQQLSWSRRAFETMWARLGARALGV